MFLKDKKGLLSERMRPTLNSLNFLVGAAKKIWERDVCQWLQGNKFHIIFWGPPGLGCW